MKKVAFSCVLALLCSLFFLQGQGEAYWANAYGTGFHDTGMMWPSPSGGYYVRTISQDITGTGKIALYLSKLDASGAIQWTKKISSGDYDNLDIHEVAGNKFTLAGSTRATKEGPTDVVWGKYDVDPATGAFTPLFQKAFGGARDESCSLTPTSDGGYICAGTSTSYGSSGEDSDFLVIKISAAGAVEWAKAYHYGLTDGGTRITEVAGGYMLAGTTDGFYGGVDVIVAKLDTSGVVQWAKTYGYSGDTTLDSFKSAAGGNFFLSATYMDIFDVAIVLIKMDGTGKIIWAKSYRIEDAYPLGGFTWESGTSFIVSGNFLEVIDPWTYEMASRILLMKVASNGNLTWAKKLSGGGYDVGWFAPVGDGTWFLTGISRSFVSDPSEDQDILYGKYDANFNPLWVRTFGGPEMETGTSYISTANTFLTGMTDSFGIGGGDVFAVVPKSDGSFPGCSACKSVTLPSSTQGMDVTTLNDWEGYTATLSERTTGAARDISVLIETAVITPTEICAGGYSEAPDISVTPASVAYGNVGVGSVAEQIVTIKNEGDVALVIGTVTVPPAPFGKPASTDKCSGKTLAPGAECKVTYTFSPTAEGDFKGDSQVPSNDPDESSVTVPLSGTAVTPVCTYEFNPKGKSNVPYKGMTINLMVKAKGAPVCPPPAPGPDQRWIAAFAPVKWVKNQGSVKIVVEPNGTSSPRSGKVAIGGNDFTIDQQATPCKLANLVPTNLPFPAAGGDGSFTVSATPTDCIWSSLTTDPWVEITKAGGHGNESVEFTVDANDLPKAKARTGKITVFLVNSPKVKKTFTVKQAK